VVGVVVAPGDVPAIMLVCSLWLVWSVPSSVAGWRNTSRHLPNLESLPTGVPVPRSASPRRQAIIRAYDLASCELNRGRAITSASLAASLAPSQSPDVADAVASRARQRPLAAGLRRCRSCCEAPRRSAVRSIGSSSASCSSTISRIVAIDERLDRIAVEISALAERLCRNCHTGIADFVVSVSTYQLPRGNAVFPAVLRQVEELALDPHVPLFVFGVFDGVLRGLKLEMPVEAKALRPCPESRPINGGLAKAGVAAARGGKGPCRSRRYEARCTKGKAGDGQDNSASQSSAHDRRNRLRCVLDVHVLSFRWLMDLAVRLNGRPACNLRAILIAPRRSVHPANPESAIRACNRNGTDAGVQTRRVADNSGIGTS
jgi:hypothetical protein